MHYGPNPRMISNVVVDGHGDLPNSEGLSGMMYAWGQFIDHDLDLMNSTVSTTSTSRFRQAILILRPDPSFR